MDSKEIKRNLKEAKEFLKNKDFKTAIKLCKAVLKEDRNNYVGLVLFGAALQETDQRDQAPNAFRKAAEVCPDQPLAWQGLISYYEKMGNDMGTEELLNAFCHLLPLENDPIKRQDIASKLGGVAVKLNNSKPCIDILHSLTNDTVAASEIRKAMIKALAHFKDLSKDEAHLMEDALEQVLNEWKISKKPGDQDIQENYRRYLKLLYRNGKRKTLLEEANSMAERFIMDPYPLEWVAKLWVEFVSEGQAVSFIQYSIPNHLKNLSALSPSSSAVMMAKGALHFINGEYVQAREELVRAVGSRQAPWHVYFLLAQTQLKLSCPSEAESYLEEASTLFDKVSSGASDPQRRMLKELRAVALSLQGKEEKLLKAVQLCDSLLSETEANPAVHLITARALVSLGRFRDARAHITQAGSGAKSLLLEARIMIGSGEVEKATHVLENQASDAKDGEIWLELSSLRESGGKHTESFTALMEAARCDPHNWSTFVRLGDHYRRGEAETTLDKARRCYQKALQLNPKSDEAAERLSDVLHQSKDMDGNLQLLTVMTQKSGAKWSWLRLGLLYTERGEIEQAISSLSKAVRADPLDSRIWESLGDAYMLRGAWNAALRSYQRVVDLCPGAVYPAYQIGTVKLRMGSFEEAVISFRSLVEASPRYVPALQMLGEAALSLARLYLKDQRLGCTKNCCQEALTALTRVLIERRNLSCTWKLLGDACLLGARLPESYAAFSLPEWLVSPRGTLDPSSERENIVLNKMELFLLAERLYCRAMPASLDNSLLWHDVATTLFWHSVETQEQTRRRDLLQRAAVAARRAVSINPQNSSHWNVLAVIAATDEIKQRAVAQHALIQALRLDPNSAVAWTNLGTLYLILGHIPLANKAFSAAQRADHDYTNSWLGQAMIAESMAHPDTMDLFRHAASLEYHPQSCTGYAHLVLNTLLEKEKQRSLRDSDQDQVLKDMRKMYAVTVARDCMQWYTERHVKDVCGWNMYGLLLEREGLHRMASAALQQALAEAIEQGLAIEKLDAVRCNLGRTLLTLQKNEEAIEVFQKVQHASFASQSGLALALYKAKKFEEAYEAYNTALEWLAPDDETKTHILISMAAMQYSFNQLEDCKTLLFQSIELKPVSPHALLALCAIGLLHNDLRMSKVMLRELNAFRDDTEFLAHIALLKAYTCFLQGDQAGALRALGAAVHRHPGEAALWLSLAQVQMHAYPKCDVSATGRTAHAALLLGRTTMDISKVQSLVCVAELLTGEGRAAAISSQKAVHQFPNVAENWATFVASVLPRCTAAEPTLKASWLRDLISHVRRRLEPSSTSLKKWLGSHERQLVSISAS